MHNIGIVILATNVYILLGLRFIYKWRKYYKGNSNITFYLFTDIDPSKYIDTNDIIYHHSSNDNWVDGTNLKFVNILKLDNCNEDYLFYFDADTNINKDFTEEWFIGDRVGGQHFGDQSWMKEEKGYDRNPNSTAYVPYNTILPQMYYYGAFFGGKKDEMINFCQILREYQLKDKEINYEPGVNDESYINKEFHYNPPTKIVYSNNFIFDISDKGGLKDTRNTKGDYNNEMQEILKKYNQSFDIIHGNIKFI
jgi:hypothetical protein